MVVQKACTHSLCVHGAFESGGIMQRTSWKLCPLRDVCYEAFFDNAPAFAVPREVNAGKDIHTIEWCLTQAVSLSHSWTVTNCQPPYRREHLQSPASRLSFESTSRPHHG